MEHAGKKRQNAWQSFSTGKVGRKKVKTNSMFASSATGRVGVVGSGRGMKSSKALSRHDKGAAAAKSEEIGTDFL